MVSHKDWSTEALKRSKLIPARRISASSSPANITQAIAAFEQSGEPLVIEGFQDVEGWDHQLLDAAWLRKHYKNKDGEPTLDVRDVKTRLDSQMSIQEFMDWASSVQRDDPKRYYGKDAVCPTEYEDWLHSGTIPEELLPNQAANLLMNLPKDDRVATLMCYLGVGETFTPCHKDLSGSSGQNIMTYADEGASSTWILTKTSDAREVSEFFQELGHELDHETHVLTMDELKKATFDVYYIEQRLGDLVLVPPRSCHQVVNIGGLTIKTSWSRMTQKGLALALYYELPLYQRVCRAETYRIKSTIELTLRKLTRQVKRALESGFTPEDRQLSGLRFMLPLYERVVQSEDPGTDSLMTLSTDGSVHEVSGIVCDFCAADIYNGFFECKRQCRSEPIELHPTTENKFVVCPGCYCEGRTCGCQCMKAVQYRSFKQLRAHLLAARETLKGASSDDEPSSVNIKQVPPVQSLYRENLMVSLTRSPSIFKAARVLQKSRDEQEHLTNPERKCRHGSHPIPQAESVNCTGCHATRCFGHILSSSKMHCMEAILLCQDKETKKDFHIKHIKSRQDFETQVQMLRENELKLVVDPSSFTPPDILKQLADISLTYNQIQPAKLTARRGWYDTPDASDERENLGFEQASAEKAMNSKHKMPSKSIVQPRPLETSNTPDDNDAMLTELTSGPHVQVEPAPVERVVEKTTLVSVTARIASGSKRPLNEATTSEQEGRSPKRTRPENEDASDARSQAARVSEAEQIVLEEQHERVRMLSTKLALMEKELQDMKNLALTVVGNVVQGSTMALMFQALREMHTHYQKPCSHNPCRGATGCPELEKHRFSMQQIHAEVAAAVKKGLPPVANTKAPVSKNTRETSSTFKPQESHHVHFSTSAVPAPHPRPKSPPASTVNSGAPSSTFASTSFSVKSEPLETTLPPSASASVPVERPQDVRQPSNPWGLAPVAGPSRLTPREFPGPTKERTYRPFPDNRRGFTNYHNRSYPPRPANRDADDRVHSRRPNNPFASRDNVSSRPFDQQSRIPYERHHPESINTDHIPYTPLHSHFEPDVLRPWPS